MAEGAKGEAEYLRKQAALFRMRALWYKPPISEQMLVIAADLDKLADYLEARSRIGR